MTKQGAATSPLTFVDNPHAPEVFASEAVGFFLIAGNIHITFASDRVNHATTPGPINRVVTARVVIPIQAAQRLAAGLYDFLKKQGLDPVPVPDKTHVQ
jgi:hypothetical protein